MRRRSRVYKLAPIFDVPAFEGFADKGCKTLLGGEFFSDDFVPQERTGRNWKVPRLSKIWKPARVIGRVRKFNDFPCINGAIPAFSQRAVDALRAYLEPNGEILPLITPVGLGRYYAYNVTTVADVLNWRGSDIRWIIEPESAGSIYCYEFFADKLSNLSIFRIPEQDNEVYVTDAFASRVRECGLQGFDLQRVWPLPPGISWWELHKQQRRKQQRKGLSPGQWVKGNTVVLRLMLSGKNSKPTVAEQDQVDAIMDDLDRMLVDIDSRAASVGNLEGFDYSTKGECRLFLSCPDADKLVTKLLPWLKKLRWGRGFRVLKRYGEYVDPDSREEYVDI